MALNNDATFEGNLTFAFKNDMRKFVNFHQSMFENLKNGTLMGSFFSKQKMRELKIFRGVLYHENEE